MWRAGCVCMYAWVKIGVSSILQCVIMFLCFLTLQTVCIEQILTLFVAFDATLRAAHALAGDAPQQPLTFITVGGGGGCPHLKIVWGSGGDGVDQSLQGLFINMALLQRARRRRNTSLILADNRSRKNLNRDVKNKSEEETHQLFVPESGGSHRWCDSSFTRVLY